MKRKFELSMSSLILLSIAISILTISVTLSIIFLFNYSRNNYEVIPPIIGSLGNVIGGIMGGIVAYLVATYQVNKNIELDGKRTISSSFSLLRLIKTELVSNKKILETFKGDVEIGNNLSALESISLDNWIRCSDKLGIEVSDDTINSCHRCITKLEAYKKTLNAIPEQHTNDLISSIDSTIQLIDKDIKIMSI
ncbi:hypothetical protein [Sporosarcina sp. FSL W7-1283]|uniref:hypothetical protein n=1 Tax=Sporosarcina sp. FSL W7-1283 TaxID=2921560 RepID=UPI0030F652E6